MRGRGAQLWQRRLIPVLIALGLRPEDICAMRHSWWRTDRGPREKIMVSEAVKNVAGQLLTGEPKGTQRRRRGSRGGSLAAILDYRRRAASAPARPTFSTTM